MVDQGAFMEAHDCHYGTPLHVACARQHYDCAKVLLNAGEIMFVFCTLERNVCINKYFGCDKVTTSEMK